MGYYVESDGDRVPKDVYICADGERVLTMECASEDRRFRLARKICNLLNQEASLPGLEPPSKSKARGTWDEVAKFFRDQAGLPQSDAEWFFNKCEGCGWKNAGKPILNWEATVRAWKLARIFPSQKFTPAIGTAGRPDGVLTHADKMILLRELETAEKKVAAIRSSYDPHQSWTAKDKAAFGDLWIRIKEIKAKLGMKV